MIFTTISDSLCQIVYPISMGLLGSHSASSSVLVPTGRRRCPRLACLSPFDADPSAGSSEISQEVLILNISEVIWLQVHGPS